MKTSNKANLFINTVNDIIDKGRINNILQLYTEDEFYNGKTIKIDGKEMINFGSCSYLGLELDERLKQSAIEGIQRYGIQFSSSRSYVSSTPYNELEALIRQVFGMNVVLTPTTTLGHQAVIPVIVEPGDVILMDQQVHASVQFAVHYMQHKGIAVNVIRHNNMVELEAAIVKYSTHANRIWYMADGIYSMYGDFLPIDQIMKLIDIYPKFHLYVDDAHGMSWTGPNGRGYVLSKAEPHNKVIIGTSFAKGFGTGGGAFLFKDADLCQKVRNCGGPMIFSGPNQIPVLAASIASARIHLSEEINTMQEELKSNIQYCHDLLQKRNIPVVSNPETPIKFIGLGLARVGYNMVNRMLNDGFYCNLAVFPAVPETCAGLRFTITLHHSKKDIESMVNALAFHFPKALEEEGRTVSDIQHAFRKVIDFKIQEPQEPVKIRSIGANLRVQYENTIQSIPRELWDSLLQKGNFDWNWLDFLEKTFSNNDRQEYNWKFHYYIIWEENIPVLATFFTTALNKDDMLASESVSYELEMKRLNDPYYLCSKTLMMGSLITEGQHLYIDRKRGNWKDILMLLLDQVWALQATEKANSLCLRDFPDEDKEIQDFFADQGFLKIALPDGHTIENVNWQGAEGYLKNFNARQRWYIKDSVLKNESDFDVEIVNDPTEDDISKWYELYRNVKGRSFQLNTFDLPKSFFRSMSKNKSCEILQLRLKQPGKEQGPLVGVTFNMITSTLNYCGIVIGLDYNYLESHDVYKQTLFQSIIRAGVLKTNTIFLGFTASGIKKKFGAKASPQVAFIQQQDSFNMTVINSVSNNRVFDEKGTRQKLILHKKIGGADERKAIA